MKTTPEIYANDLIEKYNIPYRNGADYNMTECQRIQCAIIDVENTIEALQEITSISNPAVSLLDYYTEVLNILKTK